MPLITTVRPGRKGFFQPRQQRQRASSPQRGYLNCKIHGHNRTKSTKGIVL
jgi:hypothetical protein